MHTADDAERQTMCVVHGVHIQSVRVFVCVRVWQCVYVQIVECAHTQSNHGSLPATMVRERNGLRGSERLLVCRVRLGILCPLLGPLDIAPFLLQLLVTQLQYASFIICYFYIVF